MISMACNGNSVATPVTHLQNIKAYAVLLLVHLLQCTHHQLEGLLNNQWLL